LNGEKQGGEIFKLLPQAMKDIGAIPKARRAKGGGINYRFRSVDDVLNAINPVLTKHGISLSTEVLEYRTGEHTEEKARGGERVIYRATLILRIGLHGPDGSKVTISSAGEGLDYAGDKATNKAMSAAFKYAVFLGLAIPLESTEIDDSDREASSAPKSEPEPEAQSQASKGNSKPEQKPEQKQLNTTADENAYSENLGELCDEVRAAKIKSLAKNLGFGRPELVKIVQKRDCSKIAELTKKQADEIIANLARKAQDQSVPFDPDEPGDKAKN